MCSKEDREILQTVKMLRQYNNFAVLTDNLRRAWKMPHSIEGMLPTHLGLMQRLMAHKVTNTEYEDELLRVRRPVSDEEIQQEVDAIAEMITETVRRMEMLQQEYEKWTKEALIHRMRGNG